MLSQTIPTEQIIFKTAALVARLRISNTEEAIKEIGLLFDLLRDIGIPDNGLYLIWQDRADELERARKPLKCQICQDEATGLIRTKGGRLMLTCHKCTSDLLKCGAIYLLGDGDEEDLIQVLRDELILAGA